MHLRNLGYLDKRLKMVKVICTNCNYQGDSKNPRDCPYCGMETLEKEKTAEELLNDVNRLLEN